MTFNFSKWRTWTALFGFEAGISYLPGFYSFLHLQGIHTATHTEHYSMSSREKTLCLWTCWKTAPEGNVQWQFCINFPQKKKANNIPLLCPSVVNVRLTTGAGLLTSHPPTRTVTRNKIRDLFLSPLKIHSCRFQCCWTQWSLYTCHPDRNCTLIPQQTWVDQPQRPHSGCIAHLFTLQPNKVKSVKNNHIHHPKSHSVHSVSGILHNYSEGSGWAH